MLYASLKAIHLLSIVAWVGGMFFAHVCLRPAAAQVLEPPARVRLMHAALRRFLDVVTVAAPLAFLSGAAMLAFVSRERSSAGLAFNMPLDWFAMVGLFFVMLAVFLHVRLALLRRLEGAMADHAWPAAAAALLAIRWEVMLNLAIGVFIIVMVRLGGAA